MGRVLNLIKVAETIVVDGRPIRVKRIIAVTPTHIVVEHLDGRVEAISLERISNKSGRVPIAMV